MRKMMKTFSVALAFVAVGGVSACTGSGGDDDDSTTTSSSSGSNSSSHTTSGGTSHSGTTSSGGTSGTSSGGTSGTSSGGTSGTSSGGTSGTSSGGTSGTATSGTTSSGGTSGTASSGIITTSSSAPFVTSSSGPVGPGGTEEANCRANAPLCDTGLTCVGGASQGICLKTCTTPEQQDTCAATQLCVAVTASGTNMNLCLTKQAKDEYCNPYPCEGTLECQNGFADSNGDPAFSVCRTGCVIGGSNTCTGSDKCLPSSDYWLFQPNQASAGTPITCTANTGCDQAGGYSCENFGGTTGQVCARPEAACGAAVAPADLFDADGGERELGLNEYCNLGPSMYFQDGGVAFTGSRFCDTYSTLTTPPLVFCRSFTDSQGVDTEYGFCAAICAQPSESGTYTNSDCPASYTCSKDPAYFVKRTTTACTDTCSTAGQVCVTAASGTGKVCAWPYGMCQPQ